LELEVVLSAETILKRIEDLAADVNRDYSGEEPILIGTLKGSFIFLAQLALRLDFNLEVEFISARSYLDSVTSSGRVDLFKKLSIDIENRRLLIVEDIVDTGLTLSKLMDNLHAARPKSIEVVALIVKSGARRRGVPIRYTGFELDDGFLVGFGMDYAEKYRNLPYVARLKGV
jgi:hypoxanthine phosphoribosyltransferase